ncbi:MAG TPA: YfhO family protein [Thermoanaerobaculaceae bacterium]|nr:YfhO family protein [Thermoanaerobaculaceae bacterium]HRS16187.1 YfhO family protein [Thermoanaerobaculaceae bacterium]
MSHVRARSIRLLVPLSFAGLAAAVWFGLGMHRGLLLSSDIRSLCYPWWPYFDEHRSGNVDLSDAAQQFVPWLELARRELAAGRVPLWNPFQDGGAPLLGNAQSALGSPLVWPALLLGARYGWNLVLLLKVLTAAGGAWLWLREQGRSRPAAATGAVAFALSGSFVAWLAHPHTLVAAAAPWVLWAAKRLERGTSPGRVLALAGATWLACVGGHPETLLMVAGLTGTWALTARGWRGLGRIAPSALLGAGLAAPVLLPFVEYLLLSEAWASGAGRNATTLPWRTLVRLVVPGAQAGNQIETAVTVSLAVLVLAVAGLMMARRRQVWIAVLVAGALAAVALDGPLARLLASRTPIYWSRAVLLLPLPLGLLAASALDRLRALARRRRVRPWVRRLTALAPVLALADLLAAARGVHAVTSPALLDATTPLLERVRALPGPFRVLILGHMLPPNFATDFEIEDVRGYDALAPLGWRRRWEDVAPVRDLVIRPEALRRPGSALSFWNVEIVLASPAVLDATSALAEAWGCELEEVYRGPDGRILRNRSALPRARFAVAPGTVRIGEWTPVRWRLEADSPSGGMVVVANPYFPGWRARVDGRPVELDLAPGEAIRLTVPAGTHAIELVYRPRSFLLGLGLAGVALALAAARAVR